MDRLTDENGRIKQQPLMLLDKISDHVFEAFKKLSQYENTGLDPKEVENLALAYKKVKDSFKDTITVNEIVDAVVDYYNAVSDGEGLQDARLLTNESVKRWDELKERDTAMEVEDIHLDEYYCPACGAENNCNQRCVEDNFCPVCGQRLKVKNEGIEW